MENTFFGKLLVQRKKETRAKLKEAFAVFDKENTGFIICEDVGNVLRSIGEKDRLKDAMDVLRVYRNGLVEFSNLLNFLAPMPKVGGPEEDVKATFKMFDKDGDGFVSAAELSAILGVPDELANAMVKTADFDGDGKLSYKNFKNMMLIMLMV